MKKEYYIQGDPARADKIKAAFEKLGIDVLDFGFADKTVVYCSIGGCVQSLPYSINLMHILYSHPDYKELELPVEPKFKVGSWLYHNSNGVRPVLVTDYDERHGYQIQDGSGRYHLSRNLTENEYHLWSIADAKDGDVLATDNGWTCIFQAFDGRTFSSYCFMDSQNWFYELGSEVHTQDSKINGNIHPATKEQRDLLFAKMKESGYEWDADKKELNKIQTHYDIANFHEGMPVLVRDDNSDEWNYLFFSHYRKKFSDHFFAGGNPWCQCIPFSEDTKHLLGTTDPCDERYVNW